MLFSTPFFLFAFLPIFFAAYLLFPTRRSVLLIGSCLFYGWGEPVFLWVAIASAFLDWVLGFAIARGGQLAKWWMRLGIATNIGLLVYAKYTIFAVLNVNAVLHYGGWTTLPIPQIALPLGISFIVFEKITYLVDLHRHSALPARSFLDYLNYVFLFPKLLAGPIVKYHDIAGQLKRPAVTYFDFRDGFIRFIIGLSKKVLIADSLAPYADEVFALDGGVLNSGTAWLGLSCFTLQIFFDFSGYSDMAIGLCRMLGFRLQENFKDPYTAASVTDFWRRWHISLSSWIKEYLYIPLGGSRVPPWRSYLNLAICFLLSGLWHGASWNFVIWGALHGVALIADRAFWLERAKRLPHIVNVTFTLLFIMLTWVFFRCQETAHAWTYLKSLVGVDGSGLHGVMLEWDIVFFLIIGGFMALRPLLIPRKVERDASPVESRRVVLIACAILLTLCVGRLAVSSFNPFLYFRF